jgi:hypothetical protein
VDLAEARRNLKKPAQPAVPPDTKSPREQTRDQLKPLDSSAENEIKQLSSGAAMLKSLAAYNANLPDKKNSAAALTAIKDTIFKCGQWLDQANKTPKRPPLLIAKVESIKKAAEQERANLERIRETVRTLSTPAPDFDRTGVWNTKGGLRVSDTLKMGNPPPDANTPERRADTKRQIQKFMGIMGKEVERSDAFADLVVQCMEGGTPIPMYLGKNSVGFYDDYGTLGVDVDDLDSLPDNPRDVQTRNGQIKAGVTKGEIMAHVLEERMYGYGGAVRLDYNEAHRRCLKPGSFQNRYRRELNIPSDSILYDNCKHAHTSEGCACFEALDSKGIKTTVHDIPTDIKAGKALNTPGTAPPAETLTKVVEVFQGEQDTYDEIITKAILQRKQAMYGQVKERRSNRKADTFGWDKAETADLLHFVTLAEGGDDNKVNTRKAAIKNQLDDYQRQLEAGGASFDTVLPPDLESEKLAADRLRSRGSSSDETALANLRQNRPKVVNAGSKADGSTNCSMCTLGAILNLSSEDAAKSVQTKMFKATKVDPAMQSEKLFLNSFLSVDDNTSPDKRKEALEKKLPLTYLEEVTTRYHLDKSAPDYWEKLERQIQGDFQFEGLRVMLEQGVEERNLNSPVKYEVLQDGLPDEEADGGKMYAWPELVQRMTAYPDGTQFQVFVCGELQHWIYADKVSGKVIFEDYQKNVEVTKEKTAAVALPNNETDAETNPVFADKWKETVDEYKTAQSIDPSTALTTMQKGKVFTELKKKLRSGAATVRETYEVPNSAYVASDTNKPRHPQKDEKKNAFEKGMFFAIVPKAAAKPTDARFEKKIEVANDKVSGR